MRFQGDRKTREKEIEDRLRQIMSKATIDTNQEIIRLKETIVRLEHRLARQRFEKNERIDQEKNQTFFCQGDNVIQFPMRSESCGD